VLRLDLTMPNLVLPIDKSSASSPASPAPKRASPPHGHREPADGPTPDRKPWSWRLQAHGRSLQPGIAIGNASLLR
jgi:hypothetical protein